jgi:DNA-binding transcriptional LysR family regulator
LSVESKAALTGVLCDFQVLCQRRDVACSQAIILQGITPLDYRSEVYIHGCLDGVGLACLPTLVASNEFISGRLVPILTDYRLSSFDFAAVYPETQRRALQVRTLIDFLIRQIGEMPVGPVIA